MTTQEDEHDHCPRCGADVGLKDRSDDPGNRWYVPATHEEICHECYSALVSPDEAGERSGGATESNTAPGSHLDQAVIRGGGQS